jgi:hypothetical protein
VIVSTPHVVLWSSSGAIEEKRKIRTQPIILTKMDSCGNNARYSPLAPDDDFETVELFDDYISYSNKLFQKFPRWGVHHAKMLFGGLAH